MGDDQVDEGLDTTAGYLIASYSLSPQMAWVCFFGSVSKSRRLESSN